MAKGKPKRREKTYYTLVRDGEFCGLHHSLTAALYWHSVAPGDWSIREVRLVPVIRKGRKK